MLADWQYNTALIGMFLVLGVIVPALGGWWIDRAVHRNHDLYSPCACARQGRHGHRLPREER